MGQERRFRTFRTRSGCRVLATGLDGGGVLLAPFVASWAARGMSVNLGDAIAIRAPKQRPEPRPERRKPSPLRAGAGAPRSRRKASERPDG